MLCTTLAIKYPLAFDRLVNGSDYDGMKSTLLAELRRRNKSINQFEKRLRRKWNDPLELFGGLILLCEIMAESSNYELNRKGRKIDVKYIALRKIHGRALKVSNEIFTLLKGGYPDGAHSLWRTLYELEIISHFLVNQDLDVSERYMAHTDMRRYKEAKDYQTYCKKINYEPLTEDELLTMKRRVEDLITKYGTEFCYEKGFEWIPKAILRSRSFRNLGM